MMRSTLTLALTLTLTGAGAWAKPPAKEKAPANANANAAPKVKTYNFGGLDVEGRLKTPQLLYFLNRMKSEFDNQTPDKRSFLPELKRTADEDL